MLNFTVLGSLETFFHFLTLFRLGYASVGAGGDDPSFSSYISFIWVEISLYFEFQLSRLPRT